MTRWRAPRVALGARVDVFAGLVLIALSLAGCLLIYQPWEMAHFPMRDQSTILEHYRLSPSFAGLFMRLSRFLVTEGRLFPLSTLALSGNAAAFGTDAAAWQAARSIVGFACVVLAWCVLRRCGATRLAATLGASLFAVAGSASHSWTYTVASEAYGLPFLLGALWIAAGFHAATRPRREAVLMGALLLFAIFAKETFVACAPSAVLLALCHRGGGVYGPPRLTVTRDRTMAITVVGIVVTFGLLPSLIVKSLAPAGYAGGYSIAHVTVDHAAVLFRAFFSVATWVWIYPANALFGLTVGLGFVAGLWREPRSTIWAVVVAVSLPLAGWVLYLPWRFTAGYYAVPYLFGLALLLAIAVTNLERWAPRWGPASVALAGTIMIAYASLVARNGTLQFQAESFVEGEVAATVAKLAPRVLIVAAPEGIGWPAVDMASYVRAYGGPLELSAATTLCSATGNPVPPPPGAVLVILSHVCLGPVALGTPAEGIRRRYRFRDWKRWTTEAREVSAQVWHR